MRYLLSLIIFILLINTGQSQILLLMDDATTPVYPVTADLVASFDENGMSAALWENQTGPINFAQPTTGNQPALIDGALVFDGADNFMLTSTDQFVITEPSTYYFVIKQITWTDGDYLIDGVNQSQIGQGYGANNFFITSGGGVYDTIKTVPLNSFFILTLEFNGASSLYQIDGGTTTTLTLNAGQMGYPGYTTGLCATYNGGGQFGNFAIKAIYIHSSAHDEATRAQIIDFLKTKYGL